MKEKRCKNNMKNLANKYFSTRKHGREISIFLKMSCRQRKNTKTKEKRKTKKKRRKDTIKKEKTHTKNAKKKKFKR